MRLTFNRRSIHLASLSLLTFCLAACTPGVKGQYACKDGFLDGLNLESGEKATISANMFGVKQQKTGTYKVESDKVIITIGMESNAFTREGKSLNGGPLLGTCTLL